MSRPLAFLCLVLAGLAAAPALARAPVAVGIAQREFRISTYRKVVKPGPVKFNITNFGEDAHNLVVSGPRGFRLQGPDVEAGERASVTVRLRREGTYHLLCTRANHLSLGMRTKLVVRR
jgi:plastocyanin